MVVVVAAKGQAYANPPAQQHCRDPGTCADSPLPSGPACDLPPLRAIPCRQIALGSLVVSP